VAVEPMCIVEAKVIGVMHMIDGEEQDDKIIAVAKNDVSVNYLDDVSELPPYAMKEIQRFFEDYKKLEKKNVKVQEYKGKETAWKIVQASMDLYKKKFLPENLPKPSL
jgi:inorganic pyrophosphatase